MQPIAPLSQANYLSRFFIFLALLLMCQSFSLLLGNLIIEKVYGLELGPQIDLLALAKDTPEALSALRINQFLSQILGMLLPVVFYARLVNVDVAEELGAFNRALPLSYLLSFVLMVSAIPFIDWTMELNRGIDFPALLGEAGKSILESEQRMEELTSLFLKMSGPADLLLMLGLMAVMPAICEEFVFRGVFQKIMHRGFNNAHAAVWVTAFLFSLAHFQFYGFVPRFILGAALGYLYLYSGTIWVPMVAHFTNNAIAVLSVYYGFNTEALATGSTQYILAATSILLVVVMLIIMARAEKKNPAHVVTDRI